MQNKNVPFRVALIVLLCLGGFVFPLLFALAALVAWALIGDLRAPPPADADAWYVKRYTVTAADPQWKSCFLPFCESPAETGFLEAMISAYGLMPHKGVLKGGGIALDLQVKKPPYRLDFLVDDWLIVEIDGATYHSSPEAMESDRVRDEHFRALGFTVLRIPAKLVFATPQLAVARVRHAHATGRTTSAAAGRARQRPVATIGGFMSSASKALSEFSADLDRRLAIDKATSSARLAFESEKKAIEASLEIAASRVKVEQECAQSEEYRRQYLQARVELDALLTTHTVNKKEEAPQVPVIRDFSQIAVPAAHADPQIDQAVQRAYTSLVAARAAYFATVRRRLESDAPLREQVRVVLQEFGGAICWNHIA